MAKKATGDKKVYQNVGVTQLVIDGVEVNPGDEFSASLAPEFEMQMFAGGHLVLLQDQSAKADRAEAAAMGEVLAEGVRSKS